MSNQKSNLQIHIFLRSQKLINNSLNIAFKIPHWLFQRPEVSCVRNSIFDRFQSLQKMTSVVSFIPYKKTILKDKTDIKMILLKNKIGSD